MSEVIEHTTYTLPLGYSVRPATLDDVEEVAALSELISRAQGDNERSDPETLRVDWQAPGFDLEKSYRVVLAPGDVIIAIFMVWDVYDPPVQPWLSWQIHPDHRGNGIEEYMMDWGEERARQAIDRCPPEAKVIMRAGAKVGDTTKELTFEKFGMEMVRYFLQMKIDMTDPPPSPNFPEGISIRYYKHPDDLERTVRAVVEGFRDHWGFVEAPFEQELAEWRHFIEQDKVFDPGLFILAIDDMTGKIAGVSLSRWEAWNNPDEGYLESLAVLRPYRKQGLGLALLLQTFHEFWERERKTVALHVDASSLTGATRLYEKAGMHVDKHYTNWQKVLRDGVDITTTNVTE